MDCPSSSEDSIKKDKLIPTTYDWIEEILDNSDSEDMVEKQEEGKEM